VPWQCQLISSPGDVGAGGYVYGGAHAHTGSNGFPIFADFVKPRKNPTTKTEKKSSKTKTKLFPPSSHDQITGPAEEQLDYKSPTH